MKIKELHLSPNFEGFLAIENEVKKFFEDPYFYKMPVIQKYQTQYGYYYEETVYDITAPFFFDDKYWTWLDIFKLEGWELFTVYWKVDHRVLVFKKD